MEDADSDSGIDSDGDWYHAGRNVMYGTRTDSTAVEDSKAVLLLIWRVLPLL